MQALPLMPSERSRQTALRVEPGVIREIEMDDVEGRPASGGDRVEHDLGADRTGARGRPAGGSSPTSAPRSTAPIRSAATRGLDAIS